MTSHSLPPSNSSLLRWVAVAMGSLVVAVGLRFWETASALIAGGVSPSVRLTIALLGGGGLGSLAFGLCIWAVISPSRFATWGGRVTAVLERLPKGIRWALAAVGLLASTVTLAYPEGHLLHDVMPRLALILAGAIAASLMMPVPRLSLAGRLAIATMLAASAFAVGKKLILVTDYPFSLGWSEGNRLWDYSLYFGRSRTSFAGPLTYPSYLTPGRHGLWGLVFLLPGVDIAAVRLWDALLWIVPPAGLGIVLSRRRGLKEWGGIGLGFTLWIFLFLNQGPIYAPLVLSAVVLAWGYSPHHRWRTALVVAGACFYAGISRWTWLVAPAIWAAMWALLDFQGATPWKRRLEPAVLFGVAGLAGAVLSQVGMAAAFPQPSAPYATTAAQDLLWYRLLPNPTNPLGILPALAIAIGPLALLGIVGLQGGLKLDTWSRLGIVAGVSAFLAVGLAASVKIGGGSNLHNLDMFLVGLVVLAAAFAARVDARSILRRAPVVAALVVGVPVWFAAASGGPLELASADTSVDSLERLDAEITAAARQGDVLFIDQRQLFAFGHLPEVPLVLEYELKDLMNQAMARNMEYLNRFYADLRSKRFVAIVADPMVVSYQGRARPFGEENDAWVEYVAEPLLDAYEPGLRLDDVGVWVYVPKP